jgi:hypothetical protein
VTNHVLKLQGGNEILVPAGSLSLHRITQLRGAFSNRVYYLEADIDRDVH